MNPTILGGNNDLVFPWVRYWTPLNQAIQLGSSSFWGGDSDGFLADPDDGFISAEANKHLLTTAHLAAPHAGCIVLCGDPGMGKSRALDIALKENTNPHRLLLEFRDIATWDQFHIQTKGSALWREWTAGSHVLTLAVDGVDEGLIKVDGFVGALTGMLKTEPVDRLQLVLACRSLEWPQSEGQRLLALWSASEESTAQPASGVYELCPLRERDVRVAAKQSLQSEGDKDAADEFLRELKRHRLIGLGSRPLTLKMLLQEFRDGNGKFPRSHRELYRRCSQTLLTEWDPARRTSLRNKNIPRLTASDRQRQCVAGRIAALMLLCGRSAITTPAVTKLGSGDLTLEEIICRTDWIDEVALEVTSALVEAVLETPLFWPKTEGRVGFYHQTFAESLAAEYLGRLPFPQIRSLLFQRDAYGEHVHPQLGELAAWMACESEPLLAHLLKYDPEVLLRSDVNGIREKNKAALVDAILDKARAEELFDGTGISRFFHTLRHVGLAAQLRRTFHDRSANHVARRLALSIAEACRLEEMLKDTIQCLRSLDDPSMHRLAAAALDELATPATAHRLVPLLSLPKLATSERLHVVHALLKHRIWTLSKALPQVAAALAADSMSGHILAQHATPDDTEPLLRACLQWPGCFNSLSRFYPLVRVAHRLGLARIHEPKIRALLAKVWWRARQLHQHDTFTRDEHLGKEKEPALPEILNRDAKLRHRFIADLVLAVKIDPKERVWSLVELTQPEDFSTLLERASVGSKWRRKIYAQIAAHCFWRGFDAVRSNSLIEALAHSPDLRAAFPLMRSWVLGATDSLEAAKQYRETEKWQREAEIRRSTKPKPAPKTIWRRDLAYLSPKHPVTHWMTLADNLSYLGGAKRADDEERRDVTTTPGWKFHDVRARKRIIAGARRLIVKVPGNPQHQMGGQSDFDASAYKALFLLRHEILEDRALADAVRRQWLPTIYDEFSNADAHHLEMMAIAYQLDPERMKLFLRDEMIRCSHKNEGYCFAFREFGACWDLNLSNWVALILAKEIHNPRTIRDLMDHLAEHDAPAALHTWRKMRSAHQSRAEHEKFAAATSALAGWRLFEFWNELWPVLVQATNFARQVFLALDRSEQRGFLKRTADIAPFRLAELYLYLLELFPRLEDPPTPQGRSYSPTRRMEIARLRDELPSILAAGGTHEAVEQLDRIARRVPAAEAIWIRWRKQDALVSFRRASWRPPSTDSVLLLIEKTGRRWISDEDDLVAFVLESLNRLGSNLRSSPNSWREMFWKQVGSTKSKTRLRPLGEVEMSKLVVQWLQVDLAPNKGLSVLRELQIQYNKRTDIEVSAVASETGNRNQRPIQAVIEVKGFWHPEIKTAHRDQLVADYLRGCGRTHGIYLVVWTKSPADPRRSKLKATTPEEAQTELEKQVAGYDGKRTPELVQAMVLDARLS